jgi:hypothetical protein
MISHKFGYLTDAYLSAQLTALVITAQNSINFQNQHQFHELGKN